jgi:hypothetical protein
MDGARISDMPMAEARRTLIKINRKAATTLCTSIKKLESATFPK